jgi:hypothetical protein
VTRKRRPDAELVWSPQPSGALDEWRVHVERLLPKPVVWRNTRASVVWLTGGDPEEVVVRLSRSALTVYEFAAERTTGDRVTVSPIRVGVVSWASLPVERALTLTGVLIRRARELRRARYRTCRRCNQETPPELMHRDEICRECAESINERS